MGDVSCRWLGKRLLVLCSVGIMLASCSTSQQGEENGRGDTTAKPDQTPAISNDPVTLTISTTTSAGMTEVDFNRLLVEPVKKKYPHITLKLIQRGKGLELEDQIAAGSTPDMLMIYNGQLRQIKKLDLLYDITPQVKKLKVDLNRFDPLAIGAVQVAADNGELYGLPYSQQFNATYYNKDIFDTFAAPYPKDGMMWEDAIDLAKKVTRTEAGVVYRGLDPESVYRLSFPLSILAIDPNTNKAKVDTPLWRKAFDVAYHIYTIPGNGRSTASFDKQTVAMLAGVNIFDRLEKPSAAGFTNWDVVQYPSYKDAPNTYGMVDVHVMTITKASKYKDQAMQIVDTLTSDEVQLIAVRDALRATPLKNSVIQNQFGQGNPLFKDKQVASIFKSRPAPMTKPAEYAVGGFVDNELINYVNGIKDINTAIRDAEEAVNKHIENQRSGG